MKVCRKCGVELVVKKTWHKFNEKNGYYICKECYREECRQRYKEANPTNSQSSICRKCGERLVAGENWNPSLARCRRFICRDCLSERKKQLYKPRKKGVCKECGRETILCGKDYCKTCYFEKGLTPIITCSGCGEEKHRYGNGMCKKCYNQKRYRDNAEVVKARANKHYKEHRKEHNERSRAYYQKHREKIREQQNEYGRQYKKDHPEKVREDNRRRRARLQNAIIEPVNEQEIYELFGRACLYCGSKENLTLDHVVPLSKGGAHSEDNLVIACGSCNPSKGNKPLIEWLQTQPYSQAWVM